MRSTTLDAKIELAEQTSQLPRKRYWVLPQLQGRVIAWFIAVSAVVSTSAAWVILLVVWSPLANQIVWTTVGQDPHSLFLDACKRVFLTTGLLMLVFGAMAFVSGLIISHRVAGPLHRLGRVAGRISQGHLQNKIKLRRGDYVHEFADQFNTMLTYLEERARRQQEMLDNLYRKLCDLQTITESNLTPQQIQSALDEALHKVNQARCGHLRD